jgi:hypothetical protein
MVTVMVVTRNGARVSERHHLHSHDANSLRAHWRSVSVDGSQTAG